MKNIIMKGVLNYETHTQFEDKYPPPLMKGRRLTAFFLSILTVLTMLPMTVFASSVGSSSADKTVGEDVAQNAQTLYGNVSEGSSDTSVYLTVDDGELIVGIPTSVILNGKSDENGKHIGNYSVYAKGDMSGNKVLNIYPESDTVTLTQTGKIDKEATITQDKISFTSDDIVDGITTTGQISAEGLTAGSWNGEFCFVISSMLLTEYDMVMSSRGTNNYLYYDNGSIYSGSRNAIYRIDETSGETLNEYVINRNSMDECTYMFTGITSVDNYIYACSRQETSGLTVDEDNETIGDLYVFDKELNLVSKTDLGWKASRIIVYNDIMIVNLQMAGYNIYDISNSALPQLIYEYRNVKGLGYEEYQSGEIYEQGGSLYYISTGFAFGIYIDDITNTVATAGAEAPTRVGIFPFSYYGSQGLKNNVHVYDIIVDYPYIYTTIASSTSNIGTNNDIRGIMKVNINDIITYSGTGKIPYEIFEINDFVKAPIGNITADIKPTRMVRYNDYIIVNTGKDGLALFDISGDTPSFLRLIKTNNEEVLPLWVTDTGKLFAGVGIAVKYSNNIYVYDLTEMLGA